MTSELLTAIERAIIVDLGRVWGGMCEFVGTGPTRDADLAEVVVHIHALQHMVMAQAAARAYPTELRLLGSTIQEEQP